MKQLPGLDLDRLSAYLDGVLRPFPGGPIDGAVIQGGLSNLTYVVSDGEHRLVVRRPPLGHVLPTAHDMAREYRILAALNGSAVPYLASATSARTRRLSVRLSTSWTSSTGRYTGQRTIFCVLAPCERRQSDDASSRPWCRSTPS